MLPDNFTGFVLVRCGGSVEERNEFYRTYCRSSSRLEAVVNCGDPMLLEFQNGQYNVQRFIEPHGTVLRLPELLTPQDPMLLAFEQLKQMQKVQP